MTAVLMVATAATATAHPDAEGVTDDPSDAHDEPVIHAHDFDKDGPLLGQDEFDIISGAPFSRVEKNLMVAGRGERLAANVTTDVWAHDGYAYTGTFSTLCSTGANDSGVWIWDVHNPNNPEHVGVIQTAVGSKTNDIKVFEASSGMDVLVMSNEGECGGGPGGVDIYDVTDPTAPALLAEVRIDDGNPYFAEELGVTDLGVHNIYLWSRGGADFMGLSVNGAFGNFKIYDITDPTEPNLLSQWGPETLDFSWIPTDFIASATSFYDGDVDDWVAFEDFTEGLGFAGGYLFSEVYGGYLFDGYGASANRFMHDLFINEDGTKAYVNFWDAGMVLLDITDPAAPVYVSTAIDPLSTDGEVNSHSVWTEDDVIVVEGEEDFAPYDQQLAAGDETYATVVGGITTSGNVSGTARYVGYGCEGFVPEPGDPEPAPEALLPMPDAEPGQVALVQRGTCTFVLKAQNALAAGYEGVIVFNDEARGDALVNMGGDVVVNLPGLFVGHSSGLALAGVDSAADLVLGMVGEDVDGLTQVWNGWSGLRIWDYSDPENPVLASTFDTACSALQPGTEGAEGCLEESEGGTYSSHNLIIEDGIAYVSWYSDGMLMIDISDPYNPVEVGRYHESGAAFEAQNGGPMDIWGVYKEENSPWVYASDRNGGLYVLKAYGQGSSKNGKAERTESDTVDATAVKGSGKAGRG